jgi:hypothetical protein
MDPYLWHTEQADKIRRGHEKDEERYHRELSLLAVDKCGICGAKIQ